MKSLLITAIKDMWRGCLGAMTGVLISTMWSRAHHNQRPLLDWGSVRGSALGVLLAFFGYYFWMVYRQNKAQRSN